MTTLDSPITTAPQSMDRHESTSPPAASAKQLLGAGAVVGASLAVSPASSHGSPTQHGGADKENANIDNENNEQQKPQQQQQQPNASSALKQLAASTATLSELQTNLVMQDRIIATLESDNQRLLQENKSLRQKLRDAQTAKTSRTATIVNEAATATHSQQQHQQQQLQVNLEQLQKEHLATLPAEQQLTVANLQAQLAQLKHDMDSERKDMARKISWYIDRQEVGAAQDALIAEQQQQIRDLRLEKAELEAHLQSVTGSGNGGVVRIGDKERQIKQLSRRVAELEDALRNRHPDSLTELIRATRPPLTEAIEFKKMKAQLEEAQRRSEEQEEAAQRAIAQLRLESDALRAQYAKRLEQVGEQMKLRLQATQTRRTKELERDVEKMRRFYTEKVKDLESQLAGYRRGDHNQQQQQQQQQHAPRSVSRTQQQQQQQGDPQDQPSYMQPIQAHQAPYTMPIQHHQQATTTTTASSTVRSRSSPATAARHNSNNNNTNNQQSQQQQPQMMGMPYPMMMYNPYQQQPQPQSYMIPMQDPAMQQRIWFLETRVKSLEEENRFLQKTASESVLSTGAAAAIQSQLGESQREAITLQRLLKEAQEQQRRTVTELDNRLAEERSARSKEVERLTSQHREEMQALQKRCDAEIRLRTDSITSRQLMAHSSGLANVMGVDLGANCSTKELRRYLLLLAERVHCLERQLAAAESEYSRQLSEVRRVAEFEMQVEKQKMGVALKQKNAEIDSFRIQLDSMMDQIARLRK